MLLHNLDSVEDDLDVFNTLEGLEENEMPKHSYHDHLNALRYFETFVLIILPYMYYNSLFKFLNFFDSG